MNWKEKYIKMAEYFDLLVQGDDWVLEEAYDMLKKDGLVDEDGFWIYEEDDEDKS